MSETVRLTREKEIAVVTIDNPPVNALGPGIPEAIEAAIESAAANADMNAIVVMGAGRTFIAGAEIREFGRGVQGEQPEVKLGIIPGASGTQRLPRLAGFAKAVEMCAFGEPISAGDALAAGIVDRIVEGDLLVGAIGFAREIAGKEAPRTSRRES